MRTGLAEAWRLRVAGQAAESAEQQASESKLAASLLGQGNLKDVDSEAERARELRTLHEVQTRVLGAEHPETPANAGNLASSLSRQGKYADAGATQREVHWALRRAIGAEHPHTLMRPQGLPLARRHCQRAPPAAASWPLAGTGTPARARTGGGWPEAIPGHRGPQPEPRFKLDLRAY
jgi:hypothetical protein